MVATLVAPSTAEEISDDGTMQQQGGRRHAWFRYASVAFDLLHPVDLVEDLAIGHGYEDLGPMCQKHR